MKHTATIGTIRHATLRNEDLLESLSDELALFGTHAKLVQEAQNIDPDSEHAGEVVFELMDALNEHAPSYCYFGAHCGDGSDFGFWPDIDAIDELPRVSDPADVDGMNEDCVFVNDHGNVTVYNADGAIIWDCV